MANVRVFRSLFLLLLVALAVPSFAQSTGAVRGKVTATDGSILPGVTVEAQSNVLPQPRVTNTDSNGEYRLPALPPGAYTVTYTLSGMNTVTRKTEVILGQEASLDVKLGVAGVSESITVTAEATLVNKESTEIETGITQKEIASLPVLQNYGDLQKLIPGVMYTQDLTRGPSAGASGQSNVYMFDGVNITMPLFGVLNQQPNTHDIAQVNIVKGGAKAIDFNRAGGFQIDTVSKSGTNKFMGEIGYQARPSSFVSDQVGAANLTYAQDRKWLTGNIGGPIIPDRLFFYGSYYRPEYTRSNQANLYGDLPSYELNTREYFGKATFTPLPSLLINGSYRRNRTHESAGDFTSFQAPTTGSGTDTKLQIGTLETSWIVNPKSFATFKFNDYKNPGNGPRAATVSSAQFSTQVGAQLDIAHLDQLGRFIVPTPTFTNPALNAFVQPFVDQYGYVCPPDAAARNLACTPGQHVGGGTVGFGQFSDNRDEFYRRGGQVGYNLTLGSKVTHDLHAGYQRYTDQEDRLIQSNGWGVITIPATTGTGRGSGQCPAAVCGKVTPAYFVAQFNQQGTGLPAIHSEFHSQSVELNDTLRWQNWSFNLGVLASNDVLYGQGLAKADNLAGFVSSPGTKYKMHTFDFGDMIQPRLGATWAYNGNDTVWSSYARYFPAANSDARAASWDRNLQRENFAYFDQTGKLLGVEANASSSGKWWQDGIKPPHIDEYMIGTARQLNNRWSGRVYGRYRKGVDWMEDVPNDARTYANAPADIKQRGLYVPNLTDIRKAIGNGVTSGSTYVIANLDGAFTKYFEVTTESEWRGNNLTLNGSYTWSHYYGNFDQDNSSFNTANDAAVFIGSSNIGDGPGRQLWDFKYGDLRGDRRHVLKLRSIYQLPWHGSVGAFGVYQSGQPYQLESRLPFRALGGANSDTNMYAEPAGTRRTPSTYDIDLNYTQNFPIPRGLNFQLSFDVFNVTNKQTGYNYETRVNSLLTTTPGVETIDFPVSITPAQLAAAGINPASRIQKPFAKSFYAPRLYQVAARIQF